MVRAATLPPPMMILPTAPLMGRPMMGPLMGPMGPMGPYGRPMMPGPPNNMMWGPPAYQHPIQPQMLQQQQMSPGQMGRPQHQQPQSMPATVEHRPQGFYAQRQQPGYSVPPQQAVVNHAQTANQPTRHHRSTSQQYQGVLHPAPPEQQLSPNSNGSRSVRWGPVTAKHASYPAGTSAPRHDLAMNLPRRVSTGAADKTTRHDAWMRKYSGPGQDQQPYPMHKTPQPKAEALPQSEPTQIAQMQQLAQTRQAGLSEKKRPFSWGRKSKGDSKGGYSPVNMAQVDYGAMERGEKRRSWFGRGVGSVISETERSKRAERERERDALARRDAAQAALYA